jgi:copper transporter 1
LSVRPTMTPASRHRNSNGHHHPSFTTMSPSRNFDSSSTTTAPSQLLHQSPSSPDTIHSIFDMKSYLHTDYGDTVLFKSWVLKSTWDIVLTCLAFFLLAILYEGIKCYREHLYKRLSFAVKKPVPVLSTSATQHNSHHSHHHHHLHGCNNSNSQQPCRRSDSSAYTGHSSPLDPTTPAKLFQKSVNKDSILCRLFSIPHAVQSLLHTMQAVLSYTLMLSFMTFNIYICVSIIAGTGIGYFMFCWRRITIVHVSDCHWRLSSFPFTQLLIKRSSQSISLTI